MPPFKRALASAILTCGLLAAPANAADVTIAVGGAFTSLDPHYHNLIPNSSLTQHIFDRLVNPDANLRPEPALAHSWVAVEPNAWEFRLREDARFHDGTPFTADDVAFTLARVPEVKNGPGGYALYTRPVREVVVVNPHTVRLVTHSPAPLIPAFMAALPMVGRRNGEGASTSDYNSGKAAVGTGPYRLVSYTPGDRAVFTRNDQYWGGKPHWERVTVRLIANDATRLAALKAGDVDLIDQVSTRDSAELSKDARAGVFVMPGVRNIYLHLDMFRNDTPFVTDLQGNRLPQNPLLDLRVRRALSMAINRQGIVAQVMDGQASPSGQFLPNGTMGSDPSLAPDAYDPVGARRLLAEAGYPQGFAVTLHGPNDRYVNDARVLQAVAQMWTRIGVRTQVEAQPSNVYFTRSARDEFSIGLLGWGTGTGEADSPLTSLVATRDPSRGRGASNRSGYSSPQLDGLLDQALATLDPAAREETYRQATRVAINDLAIVPLHHQINIWAARRGLTYDARNDERTMAMSLRPAQ
ncbi:ABC transporter substrate-binding protein [Roseomonas sp. 1311]|uniref:ABC transporter substrate-binding protein n=1 Tax=Roseomonas marmotae TaxID=2768161 RepID=A0ABS3KII2_9PROT|nr:ABC transporter substrate-binding protein [Roseomonas marmotae]